ncbi:MAG: hypothetical protein OXB93_03370 [Cytophagales bacterium]|nr:hypothetical protein [Cytophagales bacterium]
MPKQIREVLKAYFQTGKKPTQAEFENLIDSFLHADDDLRYLVFRYATQQDAEDGLNVDKLMTPLRTKQALLTLVRLGSLPGLRGDVDQAIQRIVGSAPAALDTLGEIAQALNNNSNLASQLTQAISRKADLSHNHNGSYYTKSQIVGFFHGTSGGKLLTHWNQISQKPSTFPANSNHEHRGDQIRGGDLWMPEGRSSRIFDYQNASKTVSDVLHRNRVDVNSFLNCKQNVESPKLTATNSFYLGDTEIIDSSGKMDAGHIKTGSLKNKPIAPNVPRPLEYSNGPLRTAHFTISSSLKNSTTPRTYHAEINMEFTFTATRSKYHQIAAYRWTLMMEGGAYANILTQYYIKSVSSNFYLYLTASLESGAGYGTDKPMSLGITNHSSELRQITAKYNTALLKGNNYGVTNLTFLLNNIGAGRESDEMSILITEIDNLSFIPTRILIGSKGKTGHLYGTAFINNARKHFE